MIERSTTEQPTLIQRFVEFVVRTAEIIVLATGFGVAARHSGSGILWSIFALLIIVLFMHTYGSGMRLLDRIGTALEREDEKGCFTFVLMFVLLFAITGGAMWGTFSTVSALMSAERPGLGDGASGSQQRPLSGAPRR
jgi:hypothetical protein